MSPLQQLIQNAYAQPTYGDGQDPMDQIRQMIQSRQGQLVRDQPQHMTLEEMIASRQGQGEGGQMADFSNLVDNHYDRKNTARFDETRGYEAPDLGGSLPSFDQAWAEKHKSWPFNLFMSGPE